MGRWKFTFDAIDPKDVTKTWKIGITEDHYRRICNHGHEKAHARIILVDQVASSTIALYKGWNREGKHDDCYVYVGQPKYDYHKIAPEICVPAPPGKVFLLFVLADGTIDEWTWRQHADGDISTPLGVEGELLWQRNQP